MEDTTLQCSQCGALMMQKSAERGRVRYRCPCCGKTMYVELSTSENTEYWHQRSELLSRVRTGIFDWKITDWTQLRKDIHNFIGKYDDAEQDIYLKMAIIACITDGFHDMNKEEYREAKAIFRVTERVYKDFCKNQKLGNVSKDAENYINYEEYRAMFKQCRYEYRKAKLYWKILFFVLKNLIPR